MNNINNNYLYYSLKQQQQNNQCIYNIPDNLIACLLVCSMLINKQWK